MPNVYDDARSQTYGLTWPKWLTWPNYRRRVGRVSWPRTAPGLIAGTGVQAYPYRQLGYRQL